MIKITPNIQINSDDLRFAFIRSSGPGGQNVNKVATAVQLKFDVVNNNDLPEEIKEKLIKLAGKKITTSGILIIEAKRFRTQEKNKQDAIGRLIKLIQKAAVKEKPRKKTKPTYAASEKRIETKKIRSQLKKQRKNIDKDF
ncbi:MAG: aminoacyl-tRNA hydrolase [Ignavibacteriales bacterium]|nr:aminoacyl-tRNA hydrolase [Ignavibacteriales bacterium]